MRSITFFAILFVLPFFSKSQYLTDSVNLKSFLFEKFIDGAVLLKSGTIEHAPLNYNTDDQNIVFIKNGKYMVIEDLEQVDTIYLQHKKFIPLNKAIYQVVSETSPVALLVSYTNKKRPMVATSDHTGTSKQSMSQVSNTVTDVYTSRNFQGTYSVELLKQYWFKKNEQIYKVTAKRNFLSSFPSKSRSNIEKYIGEKNIILNYEPDLVELVEFCNKLTIE
jgi:hypothetical protein